MFKVYWLIKRGQIQKKLSLNKQALHVLFDATTITYSLVLLGYFVFAIAMEYDFSKLVELNSVKIEAFTVDRFWSIVVVIPFVHLIIATQNPGVMFATAEYKLLTLPFSAYRIWLIRAVESWLKTAIKFIIPAIVLYALSPTTLAIIILYLLLLLGMNVLMTAIRWKYYQLHALKQWLILIAYLGIIILSLFYNSVYLAAVIITGLIVINGMIFPQLFKSTDWERIVAENDYRLWRSFLVSFSTNVRLEVDKKKSLWQRFSFWKQAFPYSKDTVYHRLWLSYFSKNISLCAKFIGVLFLLLFVFLVTKVSVFLFVFAIVVHAYTTIAASMFRDRLLSDLVQVLPWDIRAYKRTFKRWVMYTSAMFLFPFLIYVYLTKSMFFPFQLFIILIASISLLDSKLLKEISSWDKRIHVSEQIDFGSYGLLIGLAFSNVYPLLLVPGCGLAIYIIFLKSRTLKGV